MDTDLIIPVLARWLHLGPVIIAIGGAFFAWWVLLPAVSETLDDEQAAKLRSAIAGRWRMVVHVCIGLILVSGIFNVYRSIVILGKPLAYHFLFLPKLLAALGIFFLASALVGRSDAFANLRRDAKKWLGVIIALAAIIVVISGIMRNIPDQPRGQEDQTAMAWLPGQPGSD